MITQEIPDYSEPLVDSRSTTTRNWYNFFKTISDGAISVSPFSFSLFGLTTAAAWLTALGILGTPREVLSAARTYYVRTDGSNSNNGLTNTAGGAFLTIQKALNVAAGLDGGGLYDITIQLAAGTYAGFSAGIPFLGTNVHIVGDTTTPSNVAITSTCAVTNGTTLFMRGVKISSSGFGAYATYGGRLTFDGLTEFGANSTAAVAAESLGFAKIAASWRLSGGGSLCILANFNGIVETLGTTCTLSGTPNFSAGFAGASRGGWLWGQSMTFIGLATGKKFVTNPGAGIETSGAGFEYFPGSAGSYDLAGGIYR